MTLTGFAVCAHTFCAHKLTRARSSVVIPQIGIAMGFLLQIRMSCARFRKGVGAGAGVVVLDAGAVSWLSARLRRAAALVGCWCRCRCCQLAKRTGAGVSWLCALWRCRKLAVQAAYILVPASRMSTGRGILPSYLGLCWCNLFNFLILTHTQWTFLKVTRVFISLLASERTVLHFRTRSSRNPIRCMRRASTVDV